MPTAQTREELERILQRPPPTAEQTEALAQAAREFYRQVREREAARTRRRMAGLALGVALLAVMWVFAERVVGGIGRQGVEAG